MFRPADVVVVVKPSETYCMSVRITHTRVYNIQSDRGGPCRRTRFTGTSSYGHFYKFLQKFPKIIPEMHSVHLYGKYCFRGVIWPVPPSPYIRQSSRRMPERRLLSPRQIFWHFLFFFSIAIQVGLIKSIVIPSLSGPLLLRPSRTSFLTKKRKDRTL